jgi:glycine/D-amino acid oxidase-like deaminating enzyme
VPTRGHRIVSTWAFATVPQKAKLWPEQCLIWEASEPYLYLRTDPQGRVICGGEDEEFSDAHKRDALLVRKIDTLRAASSENCFRASTPMSPSPGPPVSARARPACRASARYRA